MSETAEKPSSKFDILKEELLAAYPLLLPGKIDFKAMREQGTPGPGNMCKEDGCEGKVVSQFMRLSLPSCEKCGEIYPYAQDVRVIGREEYYKRWNTPFDI